MGWSIKFLKLFIIGFGLWFFFAVLTPFIEPFFPAWQRYNRIQEEQNLDSGALYYSNVPQTEEAEKNMRRAIDEAMEMRRAKRQAKNQ